MKSPSRWRAVAVIVQVVFLVHIHKLLPVLPDLVGIGNTGSLRNLYGESELSADAASHIDEGVRSYLPAWHFDKQRSLVDKSDNYERCRRYGYTYDPSQRNHTNLRRIFFGALIASEPWEVLEIGGAEAHGIYHAMVFVESNRTQFLTPRNVSWLQHGPTLQQLYGISAAEQRVQMRFFVNENETLKSMHSEAMQRTEILKGWIEMGMQPDDVGILCDTDETFTRDYLRAIQICQDIPTLDYEHHRCNPKQIEIFGFSQAFEGSPECIHENRGWYRPDLILGACLEGIGNETLNKRAKRGPKGYERALSFDEEKTVTVGGAYYPLWTTSDLRRANAGFQVKNQQGSRDGEGDGPFSCYTGFHFHNFFANLESLRFKYFSYGHRKVGALTSPLHQLHSDLALLSNCALNRPDSNRTHQKFPRVKGGYAGLHPNFQPIYFSDPDYRKRKHALLVDAVLEDQERTQKRRIKKGHQRNAPNRDEVKQ